MGQAYQCDRCGEYSTEKPALCVEKYRGGFGTKPSIARLGEDWLCTDCTEAYEEFLDGLPVNEIGVQTDG